MRKMLSGGKEEEEADRIEEPETKALKYSPCHILNAIIIWLKFKTYKHNQRHKQLLGYCSSCGLDSSGTEGDTAAGML